MKRTINLIISESRLTVPHDTYVSVGDAIEWAIEMPAISARKLVTAVVFEATSPFGNRPRDKIFVLASARLGRPVTMSAGQAMNTGDHKYVVVVRNASNGQLVAEEDPWIHVRP